MICDAVVVDAVVHPYDIDSPLDRFADMTFQIVHGGTAFLEPTLELLERHRNLYLTLETTFQYVLVKPRVFAKIIGALVTRCGSDRLLFASGNNLMHPQPLLDAFAGYELPPEMVDELGFTQLTEDDRRNILGRNALELFGIAEDEALAGVAGDGFARARAERVPEPWSVLRSAQAVP